VLSKLKNLVLDILFPKFCVGCKKEGRYLCNDCTLYISEAEFICPVCNKPEFFGKTHNSCSKKRGLDGLITVWSYEGIMKDLIWQAKYKSLIDIPKELIDHSFLVIESNKERFSEFISFLLDEKTLVSYVPIHKNKELSRGFDQSEVIAKNLAKAIKKEKRCLLKRERETKSQTKLNKEERFSNIENAFSFIPKEKVEQVVLVDDVWTSGATMKECVKVLKRNGVKKVWGFTLTKAA
jgi:competence protein ComFC